MGKLNIGHLMKEKQWKTYETNMKSSRTSESIRGFDGFHAKTREGTVVHRPRKSFQELASREDEGSMHDWARAAFAVVMANGYDLLTPGGMGRRSTRKHAALPHLYMIFMFYVYIPYIYTKKSEHASHNCSPSMDFASE